MFHGSFTLKSDARRRESTTPHSFIKAVGKGKHRRYLVLTERKRR